MKIRTGFALTSLVLATSVATPSIAAEAGEKNVLQGRSIGYVMTHRNWAVHITPGAQEECPNGINDGQREQFKILYPDDGTPRTLLDTQLKWEGDTWHPTTTPEPYAYHAAQGKISAGLNLDGKVGANDFVSPEGERGIDNQLYRAIGCLGGYNNSQPYMTFYEGNALQRFTFNRILIELTNVDDLVNDDDVTVTTYRGLDSMLNDATGEKYLPGGTQRVDARWGKEFIASFRGRIEDGVLTTDPGETDLRLPLSIAFDSTGVHPIKGAVFKLKLTEDYAEGLIAGYADAWGWYLQLNSGWSTHHQNYGQVSSPSLWRLFTALADGYPDANGQNTALSAAANVRFARAYIVHPEKAVASDQSTPGTTANVTRH